MTKCTEQNNMLAHDYAQKIMSTLHIEKISYNGRNISITKDGTELCVKYGDDYLSFLFRELVDLIPPFVSRYSSPCCCSLSISYIRNKSHEFGHRIKINLNNEDLYLEFRKLFLEFKDYHLVYSLGSFTFDSNGVSIPQMDNGYIGDKAMSKLETFQKKCHVKIGRMPPNCYLEVKYR